MIILLAEDSLAAPFLARLSERTIRQWYQKYGDPFFKRHALTLLGLLPFGKSPTNPILFTSVLIAYQERN